MKRSVSHVAVVDREKCTACKTCIHTCPVEAVTLEVREGKPKALVDERECQACLICVNRCPEMAIRLEARSSPRVFGLEVEGPVPEAVETICRNAHMYPEQIVCYCHRIKAKEIVTAILSGARTPEQVSRMTGARTGCGILCITGVIRLLKAGGLKLEAAPGHQWYGSTLSIWDLPDEVLRKYDGSYYLLKGKETMDEVFAGKGVRVHERE
jgi:Pyruvate/2-oxoacid:ferredoxin oxidoreductase delta subunit/bacterioferritin-associated ferredoxin